MTKNLVSGLILAYLAQVRAAIFFFFFFFQKSGFVLRLSFFLQKTIYYGQLSSCKISAKTNDTILKTAI